MHQFHIHFISFVSFAFIKRRTINYNFVVYRPYIHLQPSIPVEPDSNNHVYMHVVLVSLLSRNCVWLDISIEQQLTHVLSAINATKYEKKQLVILYVCYTKRHIILFIRYDSAYMYVQYVVMNWNTVLGTTVGSWGIPLKWVCKSVIFAKPTGQYIACLYVTAHLRQCWPLQLIYQFNSPFDNRI